MFSAQVFITFCIFLSTLYSHVKCARVLVYPLDIWPNTQFHDMVSLATIISNHGHEVTILMNDKSIPLIKIPANISFITYTIPENVFQLSKETVGNSKYFAHQSKSQVDLIKEYCNSLLKRKYIIIQLKLEEFDLLFTDYSNVCARVLMDYLQLPTMLWFNSEYLEEDSLFFPSSHLLYSTMIPFHENSGGLAARIASALDYLLYNKLYLPFYVYGAIDEIKHQYHYNITLTVRDSYVRAKPLLIHNTDFSFDFPRPMLPSVITMTGIIPEDSEPLATDVENFLKSTAHGTIVVIIKDTPEWLAHTVSFLLIRILAKLPQNILIQSMYDHTENISSNIHLVTSLTNEDSLINTDVKLLITDCNTKWMQAAHRNAIPILGLSFFNKDRRTCNRMIARQQNGLIVNAIGLDESQLERAVYKILENATYKQNAVYLAKLLHDQPISPRQKFLFWVDFVIRHEGARHLHNDFINSLTWYEYHMLDIFSGILISFLLAIPVFLVISYFCIKKMFTWIANNKRRKIKVQ